MATFSILEMFLLLLASLSLIQTGDGFRLNFGGSSNTPMVEMLDMMQHLMTGGGQFNRTLIKEIRTCMASFDPQLPHVHDKIWQGIIDYWDMGGTPDDPWGQTNTSYAEYNRTVSSFRQMTIHEPCNFASNIAFYRLINEFCNRRDHGNKFLLPPEYVTAIMKVLADFPAASSFLHATNTKLGSQQDEKTLELLAYLQHQAIMGTLPNRSPILNDLSPVPRSMTSLQMVDAMQMIYATQPVDKWYNLFNQFDLPNYYLGFAGTGITLLHIYLDHEPLVSTLTPIFLNLFGLSEEQQQFVTKDFLPELRKATRSLNRKRILRNNFIGNSLGTMAKLVHAFVWQEFILFNTSIVLKPIPNRIGAVLFPKVTATLNLANNFQYFQNDLQKGANVYPGEEWCNPKHAHAKWHVLSAISIFDIMYLGDEIIRVLRGT